MMPFIGGNVISRSVLQLRIYYQLSALACQIKVAFHAETNKYWRVLGVLSSGEAVE